MDIIFLYFAQYIKGKPFYHVYLSALMVFESITLYYAVLLSSNLLLILKTAVS